MSAKESYDSYDLTKGPILARLIKFAIPIMIVNLLQVFYNSADMMIVAFSKDPDSVGAVGISTPVINFIVNIFIGCSVGAGVVLAGAIGARDNKLIHNTIHTSMAVSVLFGVVASAAGIILCPYMMSLMGSKGHLLALSVKYTRIYFIGVPFMSVTNFASALLRAKGDTKTPMYVLSFSGLFNVIFNLIFVKGFDMSVDGVAYATTMSNIISAVLLIIKLQRDEIICPLVLKNIRIDKFSLKKILHVGIPAGIQNALFSISHIVIQSSILSVNNAMVSGTSTFQPVVKGNAAAANLEGFIYTAVNSITQAVITFVGQNAGAGRYDRIQKIRYTGYGVSMTVGVIAAVIMIVLKTPLLSLYGIKASVSSGLEKLAYDTAVNRVYITYIPYFMLSYMEIGGAVLQGMSRSVTAAIISVIGSVVFRIVWILTVFTSFPTLTVIYLSLPIAWVLTGTIHYICTGLYLKKTLNKAQNS